MAAMASRLARNRSFGFSRGHRLAEYPVPDAGLEPPLGHHVHRTAEQPFQLVLEAAELEEASPRLHVDQEIEVALLVGLPARGGAEDPRVARTP
jgi:hypothetical protein